MAVEQNMEATQRHLSSLSKSVNVGFEKVHTEIGALSDKVASRGQVDWSLIVGFGALAMTIIAIVCAGLGMYVQMNVEPVKGKVESVKSDMRGIEVEMRQRAQEFQGWMRESHSERAVNAERIASIEREVFPTTIKEAE